MAHTGEGRSIRVPKEILEASKRQATKRGETLPNSLRTFLLAYGRRGKRVSQPGIGIMKAPPGSDTSTMYRFYVPDDIWESAKKNAEKSGETLTSAILTYLIIYSKIAEPEED
jgi:hypothetical protein